MGKVIVKIEMGRQILKGYHEYNGWREVEEL